MKQLIATIKRSVGFSTSRNTSRIWLQGAFPARAGFTPGCRYEVDTTGDIILRLCDTGSRKVSAKTRSDKEIPVIDLCSKEITERFAGMNAVRVIIMEGEIRITPDQIELRKAERKERLQQAVASGVLSTASISHGAGILSHAVHTGLTAAGLKPRLDWACEIDESIAEHAAVNNPCWNERTVALAMPLQDLAFANKDILDQLTAPVLLEAGIPCTAASRAGRSKKHLAMAEDDAKVGHLIAGFTSLIAHFNPAIIMLENVSDYFKTASAAILRTQLKEWGYDVQMVSLRGEEYAIESRLRQVLVAVTEGCEFDLSMLKAPPRAVNLLSDVLEEIGPDDARWAPMSYLFAKEKRDIAAGKGFKMAITDGNVSSVGTIGAGYARRRSTEVKIQHPTMPGLLRQLTVAEHAAVKGIPFELVGHELSETAGHFVLGNSVIWPAFRNLGKFIGTCIKPGASQAEKQNDKKDNCILQLTKICTPAHGQMDLFAA